MSYPKKTVMTAGIGTALFAIACAQDYDVSRLSALMSMRALYTWLNACLYTGVYACFYCNVLTHA